MAMMPTIRFMKPPIYTEKYVRNPFVRQSREAIPDHAQGAAIGGGGYGSRAAIGTGARSIG
jgi:hypothetical protein